MKLNLFTPTKSTFLTAEKDIFNMKVGDKNA